MSCLSVSHAQVSTLLSVPQEILLLRHEAFREYAKIAVGPEFIHTFPSFLILTAAIFIFWRNFPSSGWLVELVGSKFLYRIFQVSVSWLAINALLWLWLILQGIIYCSVWMYWSYESEYRDISYPWWQHVWSSYYPAPTQPPVMSASFISWIITMFIAIITLACVISTNHVKTLVGEILNGLKYVLATTNFELMKWSWTRTQKILAIFKTNVTSDNNDNNLISDERYSEKSLDKNSVGQGDIHQISYGTNWVRPTLKTTQRKMSVKSFHTVIGVNDNQDADSVRAAKQTRQRRGCHTVIPGNSSEQSS